MKLSRRALLGTGAIGFLGAAGAAAAPSRRGALPNILVSESGIGAMTGAYHAPGDFYSHRKVNTKVQANWYTAVCQVVQERHMQGVYWWSIHFEDDPNTPPDDKTASRLDFAGRPLSEKAIRSCFGSDYAGPGTGTTS